MINLRHHIALLACFLIVSTSCFSQKDTAKKLVPLDSLIRKAPPVQNKWAADSIRKLFSPKKATFRSAVLPGWGQAYNKKYWKIPIVYGALGVAAGVFFYNLGNYRDIRFAYNAKYKASLPDTSSLSTYPGPYKDSTDYRKIKSYLLPIDLQSLRFYRDDFRKNIDLSVLFFFVMWGLNVVDATVDAHLKAFDVSPDLSFHFKLGPSSFAGTTGLALFSSLNKYYAHALIGYGKMGKMIEEVAIKRGHQVSLCIDEHNRKDFNEQSAKGVDVAIEFTAPQSAFENVTRCIDFGVPVVSGSTGWNNRLEEAKKYCLQKEGAFLHSSNFSIGVNIFFQLNKLLAKLMASRPDYEIQLKEIHHTQKKDAPSGTAVTLAEQILQEVTRKNSWVSEDSGNNEELIILCERVDPVPGTHFVTYTSFVDDIEIIHTAHNRAGFALGAVLAAEFIAGKKGVYTIDDVLNLGDK